MRSQFPALGADWRDAVRQHERTLVCCYANWNPVDAQFAPVLERVIPHYEKQFACFSADIDDKNLWPFLHMVGVMTVPTLALLHQNVGVELIMGFVDESDLRARLDAWLHQ